uniref:Conserved hypothethical protein n=1 Tax=Ralstonia solanacearum TaxID=305 RepID=A0A0S4VJB9_RALSL|nr:Conserved hypothethical protein [Ralstonia solanacearum]CUV21059.1 Conserved hypothethical protein [Ralstonia solanacearum]CUV26283.1 Conserved hypothethical protein [Ralstonia solanacearum]CUV32051.1 Conserved hypothethical protein [Ralstonia solanacearum]CUV34696.1 Conserved hypothethical protein [Ralstonia solanacearum]
MVWSPEFEFDIDLLPQQRVDALTQRVAMFGE